MGGLSMKAKQEVARETAKAYKQALKSKKRKGKILDELTRVTGYARKYAIRLLRTLVIGTAIYSEGKLIKVRAGISKKGKKRERYYDEELKAALKIIWIYYDMICGKRLASVMKEKDVKPGYIHIDTVGHEGGNASGDFCWTLTMTDVAMQF